MVNMTRNDWQYLRDLVCCFMEAPDDSDEERALDTAFDAACARFGLDASATFARLYRDATEHNDTDPVPEIDAATEILASEVGRLATAAGFKLELVGLGCWVFQRTAPGGSTILLGAYEGGDVPASPASPTTVSVYADAASLAEGTPEETRDFDIMTAALEYVRLVTRTTG